MTKLPEQLIQAVSSGRAILFTGAGFSSGCKNFRDAPPPASGELADAIGTLGSFDGEGNLKFATEFFLHNDGNKVDLVNLLKEKFFLKETSSEHEIIAKLPWMRCYTTNYDNSIELAGQNVGKSYVAVDVDDSPHDHPRNNLVVHINGSITSLKAGNLDSSFKLSQSSYLTDEGFKTSPWYRNFMQDLDRCSAIVFVGYSLYDFEIEKLLKQQSNLSAYFITRGNLKNSTQFKYNKYGQVIPIETKGFAENITVIEIDRSQEALQAFTSVDGLEATDIEPTDPDVERLFIYGSLSKELAVSSTIGQFQNQYLIQRTLKNDLGSLNKGHVVITGELGNGKTIFLTQLGLSLAKEGFNVYHLTDHNADFCADLDLLEKQSGQSILLIDDYTLYPELVQYAWENYSAEKITLVATSRPSAHAHFQAQLGDSNVDYAAYSIDSISGDDAEHITKITNTLGKWKGLAAEPIATKQRYILQNTPTFATFLIDLFKSDDIKRRINDDLNSLVSNSEIKETIFAVCVLSIAGIKASYSLVSEIAHTDIVRSSKIKDNLVFNDLFKTTNYDQILLSSIFAQYFLKTQFTASEIQDRFLNIAEQYDKIKTHSPENKSIFKHVLKFSSLDRSLPDEQKTRTFNTYYDLLKRRVPWLQTDPHFWLQYGMAKITLGEFIKAQQNIDNAYKFAANKTYSYDVSYIDTQQVRLWLSQYIASEEADEQFELFKKADKKLKTLGDNIYKYRQIVLYPKVIKAKYSELSEENKTYVDNASRYIEKRTRYDATSTVHEAGQMDRTRAEVAEALANAKKSAS